MKKVLHGIATFILLTVMSLSFSACHWFQSDIFEAGDFQFYYAEEVDGYALVGASAKGREKEVLYVPAFYEGKAIKLLSYAIPNLVGHDTRSLSGSPPLKKIYFPYTIISYEWGTAPGFSACDVIVDAFYTSNDEEYLEYAMRITGVNLFVSAKGYEYLTNYFVTKRAEGSSIFESTQYNTERIYRANTAFMFNYENGAGGMQSPNEGYYFINEFEEGGLIEPPPYDPTQEGYEFAGWYKEPECINIWNFDRDTLPEAKYNEEGEVLYQETRLYAKWYLQ